MEIYSYVCLTEEQLCGRIVYPFMPEEAAKAPAKN